MSLRGFLRQGLLRLGRHAELVGEDSLRASAANVKKVQPMYPKSVIIIIIIIITIVVIIIIVVVRRVGYLKLRSRFCCYI